MIEVLLQAERALSMGMLDQAERLYWQAVESDRRNVIAIVGLARVALERGDDRTAVEFARKALALDPENGAAARLVERIDGLTALRAGSAAGTATTAAEMPPDPRAAGSSDAPVAQPAPTARSIEWPAADLRRPTPAASNVPAPAAPRAEIAWPTEPAPTIAEPEQSSTVGPASSAEAVSPPETPPAAATPSEPSPAAEPTRPPPTEPTRPPTAEPAPSRVPTPAPPPAPDTESAPAHRPGIFDRFRRNR